MNTCVVSKKVNGIFEEYLKSKYDDKKPIVFLLFEDKNHIVVSAIRLKGREGCGFMPYIKSEEITKKSINGIKKGLYPIGFARIIKDILDAGRYPVSELNIPKECLYITIQKNRRTVSKNHEDYNYKISKG